MARLAIDHFKQHLAQGGSMTAPAPGPAPAAPPKLPKSKRARQQLYLESVAAHYGTATAAKKAGLDYWECCSWLEDDTSAPSFSDRLGVAQQLYVEQVQACLISIGKGERKGVVAALTAFLEAHHEQYGRLRAELLSRVIGPIIAAFHKIAVAEGEKTGKRISDAMVSAAERKLMEFSP